MARPPRISLGKAQRRISAAAAASAARRIAAKHRGGRPSLDDFDLILIRAALAASIAARIPLAHLLRLNVLFGAVPGNSKEAAIKRVQLKARSIIQGKGSKPHFLRT